MVEEKKTGLGRLLDESIAFRTLERTLQLELEDACGDISMVIGGLRGSGATIIMNERVRPILKQLRELRGNATGADEEPPLFIGGTATPIRQDESVPDGPIGAARDHLFRAHFDGSGEGDELREDVVGAFEAYHRELWAELARKGMI